MRDKKVANQVIYVPGNHDGDFAHLVDYECDVIKKIRNCDPPESLDRSMPGVLDDREEGGILPWHSRTAGRCTYIPCFGPPGICGFMMKSSG